VGTPNSANTVGPAAVKSSKRMKARARGGWIAPFGGREDIVRNVQGSMVGVTGCAFLAGAGPAAGWPAAGPGGNRAASGRGDRRRCAGMAIDLIAANRPGRVTGA
jgi:hypothetical protein